MAPALTEAAGQAQKLKLKLPFAPPSTIPSTRLIAPTRTYRRNNNNNNKKDLVVLDENEVDADTLEKLLQACPVADIEFDVDDKGRNGDVSSKTKGETTTTTTGIDGGIVTGSTSAAAAAPQSPSCTQCIRPMMNGGLVVNNNEEQRRRRTELPAEDGRICMMGSPKSSNNCSEFVSQWSKVTVANDEMANASRALAEKTTARERFQDKLERRARRLVRRMCRLRVTQSSQHVSRQLLEFVCHQKNGGKPTAVVNVSGASQAKHPLLDALLMRGTTKPSSARHDIDVGNLLRRLESGHNERLSGARLSGGSRLPSTTTTTATPVSDRFDVNTCDGMEWTCGSLLTDIGYLDREMDSDATASSSGGESYDEEEDYDDRRTKSTPIHKRAFWKWAVDRAAVVSRWTWLQAQVSDLEYRIRQTSEIHRQIRRLKDGPSTSSSPVTFARDKSSSQVNGFVSKGDAVTAAAGSCCRTRCPTRPAVKRLLVRTTAMAASSSGRQTLMSRRSCRPLTIRCNCVGTSRSSLAPSPLPAYYCVLCGARGSPGVPVLDCTMPKNERVALLDPGFHSVLSFPRDTSLAIHFEALLKSGEHGKLYSKLKSVGGVKKKPRTMQINDHARKQCRKLKKNATVTLTAKLRKMSKGRNVSSRKSSETNGTPRRLRKRPKRSSSSRRRNGSESSTYSSQNGTPIPSPELGDNSSSQASANSGWGLVLSDSRRNSGASLGVLEMLRRKRGESEYDIDNIVIPYSMAASTRVERLQYKEILTPKWRAVPEYNATEPGSDANHNDGDLEMVAEQQHQSQQPIEESGVSDVDDQKEDVCDVTVVQRHQRCELTEKKRFLGFMKNGKPGSGGGGAVGNVKEGTATGGVTVAAAAAAAVVAAAVRRTRSMRSDSRADSSGANTPDPLSPQPSMSTTDHDTLPSLPPPSIPLNNNHHHHNHHHHHHHNSAAADMNDDSRHPSLLHERRRTTSLSKRDRMLEDVRVCTPTTEVSFSEPYVPVAPWEPRTFPLRDTVYDEMVQESSVHTCAENVHFTRLAATVGSSPNCGIPESEWNGVGDTVTTAKAKELLPPSRPQQPPPILNHCEQLDFSESVSSDLQQQQHDLVVK